MTDSETKKCPQCGDIMIKLLSYYLDIVTPYWLCKKCSYSEDTHNHSPVITKIHSK